MIIPHFCQLKDSFESSSFVFISILFFNSCQKNNNEKSNLIEGDFNGDGITETAKLIKLDKESKDFKYYYEIVFSNKEIKKINISSQ